MDNAHDTTTPSGWGERLRPWDDILRRQLRVDSRALYALRTRAPDRPQDDATMASTPWMPAPPQDMWLQWQAPPPPAARDLAAWGRQLEAMTLLHWVAAVEPEAAWAWLQRSRGKVFTAIAAMPADQRPRVLRSSLRFRHFVSYTGQFESLVDAFLTFSSDSASTEFGIMAQYLRDLDANSPTPSSLPSLVVVRFIFNSNTWSRDPSHLARRLKAFTACREIAQRQQERAARRPELQPLLEVGELAFTDLRAPMDESIWSIAEDIVAAGIRIDELELYDVDVASSNPLLLHDSPLLRGTTNATPTMPMGITNVKWSKSHDRANIAAIGTALAHSLTLRSLDVIHSALHLDDPEDRRFAWRWLGYILLNPNLENLSICAQAEPEDVGILVETLTSPEPSSLHLVQGLHQELRQVVERTRANAAVPSTSRPCIRHLQLDYPLATEEAMTTLLRAMGCGDGGALEHLELVLSSVGWSDPNAIIAECAMLTSLRIKFEYVNITLDCLPRLYETEPACRLRRLHIECVGSPATSIIATLAALAAPSHPMARVVDEFVLHLYYEDGSDDLDPRPVAAAFTTMLETNEGLDRCYLWTDSMAICDEFQERINAQSRLVATRATPLPLVSKLAFLSVTYRRMQDAKHPVTCFTHEHVERELIRLIFAFAGSCRRRSCCLILDI